MTNPSAITWIHVSEAARRLGMPECDFNQKKLHQFLKITKAETPSGTYYNEKDIDNFVRYKEKHNLVPCSLAAEKVGIEVIRRLSYDDYMTSCGCFYKQEDIDKYNAKREAENKVIRETMIPATEAAEIMGLSSEDFSKLAYINAIPYKKAESHRYYMESDIRDFMRMRENNEYICENDALKMLGESERSVFISLRIGEEISACLYVGGINYWKRTEIEELCNTRGVTVERAAALTGIDLWELKKYQGKQRPKGPKFTLTTGGVAFYKLKDIEEYMKTIDFSAFVNEDKAIEVIGDKGLKEINPCIKKDGVKYYKPKDIEKIQKKQEGEKRLSEKETAQQLGVTQEELRTMRNDKRGPIYYVSGVSVEYKKRDIDAYLKRIQKEKG